MNNNKGFEVEEIQKVKEQMTAANTPYVVIDSEDNSDEFMNFHFIGMYEGKEVVYDAALYTLRLHHSSEIYELAEHRAAQRFPEYHKIAYQEDENGDFEPLGDLEEEIGLFMAEVMEELEDEEAVKVQEHVDMDANQDFGIGLDIGLNIDKVTEDVMAKFVSDFNEDNLDLDETMYSFQTEDDEDE